MAGSYSTKMKRAAFEPYAHPYLIRNLRNRQHVLLGNTHNFSDKMQQNGYSFSSDTSQDLNTLRAEIKQIFQNAKEEAISTVANTFEKS